MTLHKDTISDLHIKVRSSISNPMLSYSFRSDRQWRLQQIQDAGNSIELASVYAQNGVKYAKKALRIVFTIGVVNTGQSISLIGKVPIEILPGKRHIT